MTSESVTIAIPAYNEEASLGGTVARALEVLSRAGSEGAELLIVNDGSTDATGRVAREAATRDPRVKVHEHARNLGFAAAQRSCYRQASGIWVFLLPADGQVAPEALFDFLPLRDEADLILGVAKTGRERGLRALNSAAYHAVARQLFGLPDGNFGACLMVRRALAVSLKSSCTTPVAMTELAARAMAAGARVTAVQVAVKQRTGGRARGGDMLPLLPRIFAEMASLYIDLKVKG